MRPVVLTTAAFLIYSLLMLGWFLLITQVAQLEADVGDRFVRLSGWPDRGTLVGLGGTGLIAATGGAALRGPRALGPASLAVASLMTAAVAVLLPVWFRGLGHFGPSTSEFL